MIPILYEPKTTDFQNNGIGHLSDAVSCRVTEERNGLFELKMEYPVEGERFADLVMSAIIMAEPAPGKESQPFSIYKITKPLDGIVTVYAEHTSYQLSFIPVSPFSAASAASALDGLKENAAEECPFEVWTDMDAEGSFSVTEPASFRSRLGGNSGSILDVYGGELEFDRNTVKLWASRGLDNGVTLRYGKNITDLKQEEYISNTITGIYPYWKGENVLVTLAEKTISADNAANFPYPRTVPLDMTSYFDTQPTEDELRTAAKEYVKKNALGVPTVSLSVSFVALWQTEEYKTIAPLERVSLCDTVAVEYPELGVSAKAKVVRTVYDVLQGRYEKIDLGAIRSNLEKTIAEQQKEISEKPSVSAMKQAIHHATNLITGVNGGYVILHQDGNGVPFEILIMDTPDITTAVNVWRFNQNGWGHSSKGYNGPYTMAATMDGGIVADYIKAGTLQGIKIIAESGMIGGWEITKDGLSKEIETENGTRTTIYLRSDGKVSFSETTGFWVKGGVSSGGKMWVTPIGIIFYDGEGNQLGNIANWETFVAASLGRVYVSEFIEMKGDITFPGKTASGSGDGKAGIAAGIRFGGASSTFPALGYADGDCIKMAFSEDVRAYLDEEGTFYTSGSFSSGSDERMKDGVKTIDLPEMLFDALNPVSFRWKEGLNDSKTHFGFLAQQVMKAFSSIGLDPADYGLVGYSKDTGMYSVAYTEFVPILVAQIKSMKKQLTAMESRIAQLESNIGGITP